MSGGKGKVDPYYERDPPKRSKTKEPESGPTDAKGAVKPVKVEQGPHGKVYYYRCEHCGEIFPTRQRKTHERAFHNKKCQFEWQKYGKPPPVFSDPARTKISEANRRSWADPIKAEKRRERNRESHQTPEYRAKQSAIAKEVASRPEWKRKQSEYRTGRKRPPEFGKKVSKSKMGHPVSQETKEKLAKIFSGKASYFYKDGRSSERQKFYRGTYWRSQCARVRQRDCDICQGCGWTREEAGPLSGHHIDPLSTTRYDPHKYPDELVAMLCKKCHSKSDFGDGQYKYPLNARGDKARLDRLSPHKPWEDFIKKMDGSVEPENGL